MDEKQPRSMSPLRGPLPTRRSRPLLALALVALGFYGYFHIQALSRFGFAADRWDSRTHSLPLPHSVAAVVPLEAHIMSKCPDARDCLRELVLPTMQKVYGKVNFTLSYIGRPTENDGVQCMHGPEECLGNIIELCAQKLYPDPKTYLGFTMCLSKDYKQIPQRSLVEDCALEHAIDFSELNNCATRDDGAYGVGMLRDSVRRSSSVGVNKSCTVRLDDKIYCIRDGGKWTDCPAGAEVNDLVIAIEKLYQSSVAPPS
ncbi:hypothetical protein B0H67DRAFT_664080 [Lasiosphaeris hirsuta]|uniref:Gamma interferon inducible lysosomal thiol reductase n=1 Tax=Lasiosphaeris hirsuta TaxID=260670 RepID=A0AA40AEZ0_9PEZI|nr:hypothetical protein B0H67DRAFT_664080 [Lasiosphaeris hirsuta]